MSDFLAAVLGRADGRPVLARRPRALFEPLPRSSAAAALAVARHAPPSSGPPTEPQAVLDGRHDADQDAGEVNAAAADLGSMPAPEFRVKADALRRPERVDLHAVAAPPNLAEAAETAAPAARAEPARTRLSQPVHLRTAPARRADAADPSAVPRDREELEERLREGALGALRPAQRPTTATAAPAPIRPALEPRAAARPHAAPRPGFATLSAFAQAGAAGTEAVTATATALRDSPPHSHSNSNSHAALRARSQRTGTSVPPASVAAAVAPQPLVQVSIGRIDVRALVTSPPAAAARPASGAAPVPALSLDAYLRRRHGGDRDGVAR